MISNFHRVLILPLVIAAFISVAFAHSGRTDSNGRHKDSKTGRYHTHRSYNKPTPSYSTFSPPYVRTTARTSPRTTARTSSRSATSRSAPKSVFHPYEQDEGWRKWTSKDGKFSIVAQFTKFEKGKAHLKKTDYTIIKVSSVLLSEADQKHLKFILKSRR